jgi:Spy/CpxP family protein refolding chaperone
MNLVSGRLGLATALLAGALPLAAPHAQTSDPFEGLSSARQLFRGAQLTEEQVATIQELRVAERHHQQEIQGELRTLERQFDEEFTRPGTINAGLLTSVTEQESKLVAESQRAKVDALLEIRSLLTPEQLQSMAATHQRAADLEAQLHSLPPAIEGAGER